MPGYRYGDLMQAVLPERAVRVITTNGFVRRDGACVMGRGIARQVRDAYPDLPYELGALIQAHGNRPFELSHGFYSLPVKTRWDQPARPQLIRRSLQTLGSMLDPRFVSEVHMPRPGCGNGQLSWSDIRPIVEEETASYSVPVFVWHFTREEDRT